MAPETPLDDEAQGFPGCPLRVGQVLVGKYRIERQIGSGGMGIVLSATHVQLEHLVAIKVMRRDLIEDDKALQRLLSEARAAAKIRSEYVARVLDVGTLENGFPFIVMEYLEGEDLADLLDRQGALEVGQAVQFLLQSCEALAEVHVAEMVHRDLKPGNLFIEKLPDGSPRLKIVDFGISKNIAGPARGRAATTSPQVMGSPYYMSPEQMRAEPVDERSDIWGLGAILFEMLTARPPFIGETLPEVYAAVLHDPAPSVESLRPGVPSGLDDVVQRCLEKQPALRFCDVADLAEALAPFGGPLAAQSVERITRILTNTELARARASAAPASAAGMVPLPSAVGTARAGTPVEPAFPPSAAVLPAVLPAAAQMPPAAGASPGSGRAGPAATGSEIGPLSATGSLGDLEPPRGASRVTRAVWVGVALAAGLVVAALWMRTRASAPRAAAVVPSAPASVSPQPAAAGEGARPAPARVGVANPPSDEVVTGQQALQPARRGDLAVSVREAGGSAAARRPENDGQARERAAGGRTPRRGARRGPAGSKVRSRSHKALPSGLSLDRAAKRVDLPDVEDGEPAVPAAQPVRPPKPDPSPPVPGRPSGARARDPWNPNSFGERQ